MNSTFGAPSTARLGAGQAGRETSKVRPITPGNALPGRYSSRGICRPLLSSTRSGRTPESLSRDTGMLHPTWVTRSAPRRPDAGHSRKVIAGPMSSGHGRRSTDDGPARVGRSDDKETDMDWKLEVVIAPVADVERASAFYVDTLGFRLDSDFHPND